MKYIKYFKYSTSVEIEKKVDGIIIILKLNHLMEKV